MAYQYINTVVKRPTANIHPVGRFLPRSSLLQLIIYPFQCLLGSVRNGLCQIRRIIHISQAQLFFCNRVGIIRLKQMRIITSHPRRRNITIDRLLLGGT